MFIDVFSIGSDNSESEDIYDEMTPWMDRLGQFPPQQYHQYRDQQGPGYEMRQSSFFPKSFHQYLRGMNTWTYSPNLSVRLVIKCFLNDLEYIIDILISKGEPRVCPPVPSVMPPVRRPGGRRQLPPTPSHPSSLALETLETLPTICVTHSPSTPGRREQSDQHPANFPQLEPSPSHCVSWPHSGYPGSGRLHTESNTSLNLSGPASVPVLGVSPSRMSHNTNHPR